MRAARNIRDPDAVPALTIDAHVHFWRIAQYDSRWMKGAFAPLKRDVLPEHLAPQLRGAGIERAVYVQAQHDAADNDWVLALTKANPWIAGVVGWVDLTALDVEQRVLALKRHPRFCGVRHITHDEPDDDWILRDDVARGLRVLEQHGVPFDLLFFVRHLHHAATIAKRFPALTLVLDHLAKPRIKDRGVDDWLPAFRAAAQCPNVVCKLSGMVTEADWRQWTADDLRVYVDHALEAFGPQRLMYGSDWPVCELAADYARVAATTRELIAHLSAAERSAILGGTAKRSYRLAD